MHADALGRLEIQVRLHRLRRIHVKGLHEPARLGRRRWAEARDRSARVAAEPAFIAESVLIAFGQVSVRSVKDVTDRVVAIEQAVAEAGFVVRDPMPDFELHHLAMTVGLIEFERAIEGVRRLLVVIEHEVAADGGDPTRESDAEPPPRDVDLVYPLIANVSVPCLPDPVPVVMK